MSNNSASLSKSLTGTPSRRTEIIAALERFAQTLRGAISELEVTDAILAEWDLQTISPSEVSALLPALRAAREAPARIDRMRKSLQDRLRAAVKRQKEEIDELVYLLDVAGMGDMAGNDLMLSAAQGSAVPALAPEGSLAAPQDKLAHTDAGPAERDSSPPAQRIPPAGAAAPTFATPEAVTMPPRLDSQTQAVTGWRPITVSIASAIAKVDLSRAQSALLDNKDVLEVRPDYQSRSKVVLSLRVGNTNEKLGLRETLEKLFATGVSDSWTDDNYAATIGAK